MQREDPYPRILSRHKTVADAGELLGKEKEDLTLRDRASAGAGGLVDFLSFGLLQKEKVAKFLAGEPNYGFESYPDIADAINKYFGK